MRTIGRLASMAALCVAVAASADAEPSFQGTWEIGVERSGKPRQVVGYFALGCRRAFRPDGSFAGYADAPPSGPVWKGQTTSGLTAAWIERFDVTLSADGRAATGTWYNGYETFRTSWRRVHPVNVRIHSVSQTKDTVRLQVVGSKLFYYERGRFPECGQVRVDGTGMAVTSSTVDPQSEAVTVDVSVKPETPAGRRFLWVDGTRLAWEWRGAVSLAPTRVERPGIVAVRFGRLEEGQFIAYAPTAPMPYDRPFAVQVRYGSAPPYDQTTVTLRTDSGTRHEVPIYKLETNPEVFQSRAMVFDDPTSCRGLRICDEK